VIAVACIGAAVTAAEESRPPAIGDLFDGLDGTMKVAA
jgi:hypothetical protein